MRYHMTHNLEKSHFPIWLVWPKWFDSANQVLFSSQNRKFKNTSFYTSFDAEFHADSESVKIFKKFQILDPILVKKLIFWGRFSTLMGRFLILRSIKIGQPIHHSNQHQILFKMRYRLTWFSDHPLKTTLHFKCNVARSLRSLAVFYRVTLARFWAHHANRLVETNPKIEVWARCDQ